MPKDGISEPLWILEIDGSFKAVRGGAGMVLQFLEDWPINKAIKFLFVISNNEAKYEVVLLGL